MVRGLVYGHPAAVTWLRGAVAWPSLVYVEVAHVVLRLHRAGRVTLPHAQTVLEAMQAAPAQVRPVESLVRDAWELGRERGLSVHDACYVVLAEALDAPLVTADRRLAAATPNAVLITD